MELLLSWLILCTPYNHAPCYFMQSHIHKVHACLTVTCQLHFWQNDWDLLCATEVTWGWNGYWNKSQHRSWPWRRNFSCHSCKDLSLWPFSHESGTQTTELTSLLCVHVCQTVCVCVCGMLAWSVCMCVSSKTCLMTPSKGGEGKEEKMQQNNW